MNPVFKTAPIPTPQEVEDKVRARIIHAIEREIEASQHLKGSDRYFIGGLQTAIHIVREVR